jgi:hypothetical protein
MQGVIYKKLNARIERCFFRNLNSVPIINLKILDATASGAWEGRLSRHHRIELLRLTDPASENTRTPAFPSVLTTS